jgi:hypothetical protein
MAHFKSLRQCHTVTHTIGPVLAYLFLSRLYTAMQQEIAITVNGGPAKVGKNSEIKNGIRMLCKSTRGRS